MRSVFSLDKQRKVSRLSVREPTLKSASRSVSLMIDTSTRIVSFAMVECYRCAKKGIWKRALSLRSFLQISQLHQGLVDPLIPIHRAVQPNEVSVFLGSGKDWARRNADTQCQGLLR